MKIDNHMVTKKKEFQKHLLPDCSNLQIDANQEKFTVIAFNKVHKIFKAENINNFLLLKDFI